MGAGIGSWRKGADQVAGIGSWRNGADQVAGIGSWRKGCRSGRWSMTLPQRKGAECKKVQKEAYRHQSITGNIPHIITNLHVLKQW